jgi:kynurenine formamidase
MKKTYIDLTHSFDEHTIYWPTEDGFAHEKEFFGQTDKGYFYSSYRFCGAEHGGTHIDAPIHFYEHGQTLDEIPLNRLVGPGVVIDASTQSAQNRDYLISTEDFIRWEQEHQQSLNDTIILLRTGFSEFWPDHCRYLGTDKKGQEGINELHFPGLHKTAALWLVQERNIRAIGIDTASIDFGQTSTYDTHRILCASNTPAFENVAHLDRLPAFGFTVIALPMKIKNGSGGPLRIIALL